MFLSSPKSKRGFSLIELLVSISIMLVITAIVVTQERGYNNKQVLKNVADTLALDIRTAQVYGTGVKVSSVGDFQSDYGIMLDDSSPSAATNYISFADQTPKNGYYDGAAGTCSTSECIGQVILSNSAVISRIDVLYGDGSLQPVSRADILFRRPDLSPRININQTQTLAASYPGSIGVQITLSTVTEQRIVRLYTTGQISVQ